ncbi:MAG TPA: tetratricopeptide repeat protein [Alphaproteobacteria bacterium]|nr:tetratricopeptide repeat protein [Alphaproteobacteria bacterium]
MSHQAQDSAVSRVQQSRMRRRSASGAGGVPKSESLLERARRFHQAGRLAEAEPLYRAQLKANKKDAAALHGLGALHSRRGRFGDAVRMLRQALAADPKLAEAHNDLGNALHAQGRWDEALTSYERALALKPDFAPGHYNRANALAKLRRFGEAIACLERAIALKPDYAEAHHNLGTTLAAVGRHEDACARYRQALAINPAMAEAHFNLGNSLAALDRREDAFRCYETAIALRPDYVAANMNLGIGLASLQRNEDAAKRFARVIEIDPRHPEAHNNLGAVLQALGRNAEAVAQYETALALRTDYAEARFNLGNALVAMDRGEDAVAQYDAALAIRPTYAEAHYNRGNALKRLARDVEAVAAYEATIALKPDYMEAYNNLGNALLDLRRLDAAVARFQQALALKPDAVEVHNNLGTALQGLGRHDEALKHLDAALELKPRYADAHTNRGNTLMEMGRLDDARHAFEAAIECDPTRPKFYRNLMDSKRFAAGDPHLVALQEMAKNLDRFDAEARSDLHFALGKALGDAGDYADSFRHLIEGNAVKRRSVAYNEAAVLEFLKSLALVFTREMIAAKEGRGHPSQLPVFIVGMPRSGTTLIEQILASHSKVFGGGELSAFSDVMATFSGLDDALAGADPAAADAALRDVGERYVGAIKALAPGAERITDKMPANFRLAGLIHLALPNARIIHARRNPIDTCLSCFGRAFSGDQPFTYDLAELGRYYRAYDALMAHWRRVLPERTFLEVNYEDVVGDLEGQARRIVAHCGLEWDEACLQFYRTERLVRTASATQVRQPIYKTSVGRWRAYGELLRPLLTALGPELTGERAPPQRSDSLTAQAFENALSLHRQDRLVEAAHAYGALLDRDPDHFGALHGLGLLRARQGHTDEAVRLIGEALRRNPNSAEAYNDLALILAGMNRYDDALVLYRAAVALKPDFADALGGMAGTLQALNRPQEAIAPYEQVLALRPTAYVHNNLGNALVAANRCEEAIAQYERALAMKPDFAEAYSNLGVALQALRRFGEAEAAHRQALALRPGYFDAHYNLGVTLWAMDRQQDAIASYEAAVALRPSSADAQATLGKLLMETGRIDDAVRAFERAVDAAPSIPAFYRLLTDARRMVAGEPRLAAMEALARRMEALPPAAQTELHFALGKAYADIGDVESSFAHLRAGNSLKRRQIAYDEAATLRSFERTKAVFTPELMAEKRALMAEKRGDPSPVPVFVVGMWRSGTTLIEQLLAGSPSVFGAGELTHIAQAAASLYPPFPEAIRGMSGDQLRALGAEYVARLRAAAPGAEFVVDKMPVNFRFLGLIQLALPNARIVHARRTPLDTCWSCFSRLFTEEQPYIYDLGELGRYYRAYHALMDHWRRVLPAGVMIDVDYEEVVAHTEREARRIFAHCGVAWEPSCLEFHKTARPVRSASAAQVRQPIYASSIGRWRAYRAHLAPLFEGLGETLVRETGR